jgi:hypothetical protein
MTKKATPEFNQLWQQYSKEDLWNRVTEWWESASRSRVVMLLAMHHTEELSLPFIVAEVGEPKDFVMAVLDELVKNGQVQCIAGDPKRFRIADEDAFLGYIRQCCQRTSAAAGFLGTLASWATQLD